MSPDDPPTVAGYPLRALIGAGGMGRVYLSFSPGGRALAIKVVRPEFAQDPEFRRRFAQEVAAAQRVQGLYTAQVVDADAHAPLPWLATAYVAGPSLRQAVAEHGPFPLPTVFRLLAGVAEGLAAIHACRITHRDLKPANVLLADDGPRVIDFGIAHAANATTVTRIDTRVGTPAFMAPEQVRGLSVTPAADVFALGNLAVFAATGAPAFGEGHPDALLFRIVNEPADLSACPAELRAIVERCLAKEPGDRPDLTEVMAYARAQTQGQTMLFAGSWLPPAVVTSLGEYATAVSPQLAPTWVEVTAPVPSDGAPGAGQGSGSGPGAAVAGQGAGSALAPVAAGQGPGPAGQGHEAAGQGHEAAGQGPEAGSGPTAELGAGSAPGTGVPPLAATTPLPAAGTGGGPGHTDDATVIGGREPGTGSVVGQAFDVGPGAAGQAPGAATPAGPWPYGNGPHLGATPYPGSAPDPGTTPYPSSGAPYPGNGPASGAPYPGNGPASGAPYPGSGPASGAPYLGNGPASGAPYPGSGPASGAPYLGNGPASGAPYPGNGPLGAAYPGTGPAGGAPYPGSTPAGGTPYPGSAPDSGAASYLGPDPGAAPYPGTGPQAGPYPQPAPGWNAPAYGPPVGPGPGKPANTAKILAVVAAGVIVLALCAFGSLRAYGMVSRMVAHNASSSNPDRTPESTRGTPEASTRPTYDPPSATPSFDPNTMNDADTDRTPQTSDALLPDRFTDSNGRRFTLKAAGSWSCVTTSQTQEVQDLLTRNRCVSAMTGSYIDADDTILVSVKIRALKDRATAKTVHDALAKTPVGASGIYCPQSGPGAKVCDGDYSETFKRAVKKGQVGSDYRYVIDADAVFVDMREDTRDGPALQAAVERAMATSGPRNVTR